MSEQPQLTNEKKEPAFVQIKSVGTSGDKVIFRICVEVALFGLVSLCDGTSAYSCTVRRDDCLCHKSVAVSSSIRGGVC
jgi:hypothetical protein